MVGGWGEGLMDEQKGRGGMMVKSPVCLDLGMGGWLGWAGGCLVDEEKRGIKQHSSNMCIYIPCCGRARAWST